jgi:hypothetical protein
MSQAGHLHVTIRADDRAQIARTAARLRTDAGPAWWEGDLVLTSDALVFRPSISNARIDAPYFRLADIDSIDQAGRNAFCVCGQDGRAAVFEIPSPFFSVAGIAGRLARPWVRDIESARAAAMSARPAVASSPEPRRVAG